MRLEIMRRALSLTSSKVLFGSLAAKHSQPFELSALMLHSICLQACN